jgi:UPF0271 protein
MPKVDLNSDLGEGYGPWTKADDDGMLALVSSANVACGGHASDPETMYTTLRNAMVRRVVIGAHPGYADRAGFGRRVIPMAPEEIGRMVAAQIGSLQAIAALAGTTVRYVKPHGALGNLAADKRDVADAIADAVGKLPGKLAILAISGTELEQSARAMGIPVFSEIFADRNYLKTGRLVPRSHPEAMIHDSTQAAKRLVKFFETGLMPVIDGEPIRLAAQSICIHSDTPGAVAIAGQLRSALTAAGLEIAPFLASAS